MPILQYFSYAIWHFVITSALLSLFRLLPPIEINTALKNHIFTSYPFGAYLNAAVNPVLLYLRILKKNLSGRANAQKLKPKFVEMEIKAEKRTATLVEKTVENEAVVQKLEVNRTEFLTEVSFVTSLISRMNSAHRQFKRSFSNTWSQTIKDLQLGKTKVEEKDFVALEEIRQPAVVVDKQEGSLLTTLSIQPMSVQTRPIVIETRPQNQSNVTSFNTETSIISPVKLNPPAPLQSFVILNVNNATSSFVPLPETATVRNFVQPGDPSASETIDRQHGGISFQTFKYKVTQTRDEEKEITPIHRNSQSSEIKIMTVLRPENAKKLVNVEIPDAGNNGYKFTADSETQNLKK